MPGGMECTIISALGRLGVGEPETAGYIYGQKEATDARMITPLLSPHV